MTWLPADPGHHWQAYVFLCWPLEAACLGDACWAFLAACRAYRVAVNQDIVALDAALTENAEVAIFPPVTGG